MYYMFIVSYMVLVVALVFNQVLNEQQYVCHTRLQKLTSCYKHSVIIFIYFPIYLNVLSTYARVETGLDHPGNPVTFCLG